MFWDPDGQHWYVLFGQNNSASLFWLSDEESLDPEIIGKISQHGVVDYIGQHEDLVAFLGLDPNKYMEITLGRTIYGSGNSQVADYEVILNLPASFCPDCSNWELSRSKWVKDVPTGRGALNYASPFFGLDDVLFVKHIGELGFKALINQAAKRGLTKAGLNLIYSVTRESLEKATMRSMTRTGSDFGGQILIETISEIRGRLEAGLIRGEVSSIGSTEWLVSHKRLNFSKDESVIHFNKHGNEIMDAFGQKSYNLKNYIDDANNVVQTEIWVPEMHGFVKIFGGKGKAKAAFVGLNHQTENITTFHIKTVREIAQKAPSLGWEL